MTINKMAPTRGWVKRVLCSGAVLGMGLAMGMQAASASEYGHSKSISFTPFSRVATMPVEIDSSGTFDKGATDLKAKAAAKALGVYLVNVDEGDGSNPLFQGGNWILGGYEGDGPATGEDVAHSILGIPKPDPIAQKINVLDLCNKTYASMALGVAPIVDDKKVVNGYTHATALPCEVAIHYDDENIYVDMLNPDAIFKLFFSDVLFSDDMKDDAFAAAIQAMPTQVKTELKAIIYTALTEFDPDLVQMDERIGPAYEAIGNIINAVKTSPQQSPYKHVVYTRTDGAIFLDSDRAAVAQTIINTMSIHGQTTLDGREAGEHVDELESILSESSSWRSARPVPLPLPGKNLVIEACSPFFAKKAMGTGAHHATALPCEIAVQLIDGGEKLVISYLDANFMFGAMFSDISAEEQAVFSELPGSVMADLEAIVNHALTVDLEIDLNPGEQISYNMLPGKKLGKFK